MVDLDKVRSLLEAGNAMDIDADDIEDLLDLIHELRCEVYRLRAAYENRLSERQR